MEKNLDFILSGFQIDPSSLFLEQHKFVVEPAEKPKVYVAKAYSFPAVVSHFNIKNYLVGSGGLFLDKDKNLVLNGSSLIYGAVSERAAKEIGRLISEELRKNNVEVKDIILNLEGQTNAYWSQLL